MSATTQTFKQNGNQPGKQQGNQPGAQDVRRTDYRDQVIPNRPPWGTRTAWDILLHNLSLGLFFVATLGALTAPSRFAGAAVWAWPLAMALLLVDLALLVFDLGDWRRFHHMLRTFNAQSPMSVGTWGLTLFALCLAVPAIYGVLNWPLVYMVQGLLPIAFWTLLRTAAFVLAGIGLLPAFAAMLYKGVLFSVTAQPRWRDARWFGAYVAVSALVLGCALLLPLVLLAGEAGAVPALRLAMAALLVVEGVLLWLVQRATGMAHRWWVLLGAIVLPLALLAVPSVGAWLAAGAVAIVAAAWVRVAFVRLVR